MTEFAVARIGPGKLDAALVAAVEPAFEQVADMAAHLGRIGLEHGLHVAHDRRHALFERKSWRAEALQ